MSVIGIGTDIAAVGRIRAALQRHKERFAEYLLIADELAELERAPDAARFLAKRFAAKEAFAKAFGTGIRHPVGFHSVSVGHDALGKPLLHYHGLLLEHIQERGWHAHLSISDEKEYAVAFVLIEQL